MKKNVLTFVVLIVALTIGAQTKTKTYMTKYNKIQVEN